jgi:aryl-alcohol dehydrogenase-like predicted oxidoreductase
MKYRPLGRTGFLASQIGAGDLADRTLPREVCVATLERALAAGINVVDTAPGYEDGFSELIVGDAVRQRRSSVFVITKIDDFERPLTQQLNESLERLQTSYVDGYVFHGLSDMATYERLIAQGYFAELADLKARGLVRHGGISSHHPEVLRAAIQAGYCDIAMFAVGAFVDDRYVHETLPLCRAMGVASVCFKTFGAGKLVADTEGYGRPLAQRPRGKLSSGGEVLPTSATNLSVAECLHYTLTVDPDVALLGLSFANEQDDALAAYRDFRPLTDDAMTAIRAKAAIARTNKGPCWWNPDPTQ